jgi:hypothetical protein
VFGSPALLARTVAARLGLTWLGLALSTGCVAVSTEGLSQADCVDSKDCGDGAACVEGRCVAPTDELCDGEDQDGDGRIDEGFDLQTNPDHCGICGFACPGECLDGACVVPPDGDTDCTPTDEVCDGADQDCDEAIDEGTLNACGACGEVPVEVCDGADQDCDGATDEGLANACGACGELPEELPCTLADEDCDAMTDENDPPEGCMPAETPEATCDGLDDDTDGRIDEGLLNRCGDCGPLADEVCDGVDQDCDASTDEAALGLGMPCGAGEGLCVASGRTVCTEDLAGVIALRCNAVPGEPREEVCGNGLDEDCDTRLDEGFEDRVGAACSAGVGVCEQAGVVACGRDGVIACDATPGLPRAEACDGFFDDDCDGTVDEGFDLSSDPLNCGFCGFDCTAPNAVTLCEAGRCALDGCEDPWADVDRRPENGCECNVGAPDAPDPEALDSNCDGVDGELRGSIFVSVTFGRDCGLDRGRDPCPDLVDRELEGTSTAPVRSLLRALELAGSRGVSAVLLDGGTYAQNIAFQLGFDLSFHGGYDYEPATGAWSRPGPARSPTVIQAGRARNEPVFYVGSAVTVLFDAVTLDAPAAAVGQSAIALVGDGCRSISLRDARVLAREGGTGAAPASPDPGRTPSSADAGGAGDLGIGGTGGRNGTCPNGTSGGNGGSGGGLRNGARPGEPSASQARGGDPADEFTQATGGDDGQPGETGQSGRPGPLGGVAASGVLQAWRASDPSPATPGAPGGGGGGGGGGYLGIFAVPDLTGHGGGGGGAGGCGGLAGLAGGSGGGSFGVILLNGCSLAAERSTVESSAGGAGAAGTTGAEGARGGEGGASQSVALADQPGGAGGRGGTGGCGGTGPSGHGGPSLPVLRVGAPAVVLDPQSRLVPGAGGLGAAGAQSRCGADEGVSGLDGFSGPTGCCALGLDCGDALACAD